MGARRMIVGVLVLAALLVAGCGDTGSTSAMDAKFQKIDFEMPSLETVNSAYDVPAFVRETHRYVALIRAYAGQLGHAEARRRLMEKGDELSSYCLPCVATLDSEALKY
jgi:outer membrane murein-binding lipoprotein Lpp